MGAGLTEIGAAFEPMTLEEQARRREQARAYLQEIRELAVHVRVLEAEIAEQRETAKGVTGIDYSKVAVATSPYGDAVPDAVARLLELIGEACSELAECAERQDEARKCLREMGGREADVLTLRYLLAMSWKEVGARIGYSTARLKELHRDALFCFYEYMPHYQRAPEYKAI